MTEQLKRVLVVEDDTSFHLSVREKIKRLFQGFGFNSEVIIVKSGEEAVEKVNQTKSNESRLDAIVVDYRLLGRMTGIAFLNTVKNDILGIPIFLFSGDSQAVLQPELDRLFSDKQGRALKENIRIVPKNPITLFESMKIAFTPISS